MPLTFAMAIDTVVRDPSKPVGYRYRNNAPADGTKLWVTVTIYDHHKNHWSKRVLLELPGGQRRPRGGHRLTPA